MTSEHEDFVEKCVEMNMTAVDEAAKYLDENGWNEDRIIQVPNPIDATMMWYYLLQAKKIREEEYPDVTLDMPAIMIRETEDHEATEDKG